MTKAGTALLAVLAGVSTAVAQPVPPGGFRYERDVVVTAPGPQRLDLDAILIAGARTVITEPVTTFKCFLYDLSALEGLYRVGAFLGLGISLALVSLVLQKYVLAPKEAQS